MTSAPTAAIVVIGAADYLPDAAWMDELLQAASLSATATATATAGDDLGGGSTDTASDGAVSAPVEYAVGDERVVEILCTGPDPRQLRVAVEPTLARLDSRVSSGVVPPRLGERARLLVVFDVDSTFIQDEVIELLAAHAGRDREVAAVTEAAMRGELDFAQSLRERVAVLEGLTPHVLAEVRAAVRVTPGAVELVAALQRAGHVVALVSGGFIEIVAHLATDHGIAYAKANALDIDEGKLTGRVRGEIVDRAVKARTLRELALLEGVDAAHTVAVGDGANDLDMISAAGLGIAVNAKQALRDGADLVVDTSRLDVLLPVLGIR